MIRHIITVPFGDGSKQHIIVDHIDTVFYSPPDYFSYTIGGETHVCSESVYDAIMAALRDESKPT